MDYSAPPAIGDRRIEEIHFHHSGGCELDTVADVVRGALSRDDEDFSLDPYNYHVLRPPDTPGVELGVNQWIVQVGRPASVQPASVKHHNEHALAVVVHGRWDLEPLPSFGLERLVDVLSWLCRTLQLPVSRVYGHRERKVSGSTACPGIDPDLVRRAVTARLEISA